MLEGLEISEVTYKHVLSSAETARLDPEYFRKEYLNAEEIVVSRGSDFTSFKELGLVVDASAFYPSVEPFYGTGELPFLRVADVDSIIDFDNGTAIPDEVCDQFKTLKKVYPGDIVMTKGGSVARIGLVTKPAAACRDLIFVNSSNLAEVDRLFLYLYLQTSLCYRWLVRSSSQTAQPHLTITLVRNLPIFIGSESFKEKCASLVKEIYHLLDVSKVKYMAAEDMLLSGLGLHDWKPPEPLTYAHKFSDAFSSNRLDAEFFRPKFDVLEKHIVASNSYSLLGDLMSLNRRGKQPLYVDSGITVVNSKHVNRGSVTINSDNRFGLERKGDIVIKYGDVLVNGTGVGTIGRAAPYLKKYDSLPDNHVTVLRPKKRSIDPVYLSVYLNSLAGKLQVDKWFRGSSGQIELYPDDLSQFKIWMASDSVQSEIRKNVEEAFSANNLAQERLNIAVTMVEIAIEESEKDALKYLEEKG